MVNSEDIPGAVRDGSPLPTPVIAFEAKPGSSEEISHQKEPSPPEEPNEEQNVSISSCSSISSLSSILQNPVRYDQDDWIDDPMLVFDRVINAIRCGFMTWTEAFLDMFPNYHEPPQGFSEIWCSTFLIDYGNSIHRRQRIESLNSFEDAVQLIRSSKNIMVLSGAGVSVSCGIPDFRSENGIYARLHIDFPDLPDPTSMFDIHYFDKNPKPFYDFANEIFMGQFEPSLSHKFIRQLEINGQLLRNFTQNIDTIEKQTGIQRVTECHGSFATATCRKCRAKYDGEELRAPIRNKVVPFCAICKEGVIKPDIVFFGEDLPQAFHKAMIEDKPKVDLLIVMGSSLRVAPVNAIPSNIPRNVPQILINREALEGYRPDINLLGNCDDIIREICFQLGGSFEQVVHAHDAKKKALDHSYKACQTKRTKIEHDEFIKIMHEGEEDFQPYVVEQNSTAGDDSAEPVVKKPRIELDLTKKRFISIAKKFPRGGCYFQTLPNTAIFFGCTMYYDLWDRALRIPPDRPRGVPAPDLSSAKKESSVSSVGSSISRCKSEANLSAESDNESTDLPRCISCEPAIDVESLVSPLDFAKLLFEIEESDSDESVGDPWIQFSDGGNTPKLEFDEDEQTVSVETATTTIITATETKEKA